MNEFFDFLLHSFVVIIAFFVIAFMWYLIIRISSLAILNSILQKLTRTGGLDHGEKQRQEEKQKQ